jgi:phenylacetate-CoA ligase
LLSWQTAEPLSAAVCLWPQRSDGAVLWREGLSTDIEEIINSDPDLVRQLNSFQISSYEDEAINRRLKIRLETVKEPPGAPLSENELHQKMFDGLCRVNQDFREVTKMFDRTCVEIEIYEFEQGPFSGRDIRIKNKYVG